MTGRPRTLPDTPETERRRETYRQSKRRAAERKAARKTYLEEWFEKLKGTGSPERRELIIEAARLIYCKQENTCRL